MRGRIGRLAGSGVPKADCRRAGHGRRHRAACSLGADARPHDQRRLRRTHRMAERVAVIGAGQMGNGIAHVFAQSGFDVTMIDVSADALERGRDDDRGEPRPAGQEGDAPGGRQGRDPRRASRPTKRSTRRRRVARHRSGDREPRPQVQDLRRARPASRRPTRSSPRTPARSRSPRSRRAPSGPTQVIGMHFMNPVPVMQLVEVIRGLATSRRRRRSACSSWPRRVGKTPVEVKDYPGLRREPRS